MAIQQYSKYQYETSPRKLESDYNIKPKTNKRTAPQKKQEEKKISQKAIVRKRDRAKLVIALVAVFAAVFTVSYRNSKIDEAFTKNEELKQSYLAAEKENEQIKVEIENSLNYNNVEQQAKELLGMQKLSNKQTVYVNLPKKDYIQPATETVVIEKDEGILNKILNKIKGVF